MKKLFLCLHYLLLNIFIYFHIEFKKFILFILIELYFSKLIFLYYLFNSFHTKLLIMAAKFNKIEKAFMKCSSAEDFAKFAGSQVDY